MRLHICLLQSAQVVGCCLQSMASTSAVASQLALKQARCLDQAINTVLIELLLCCEHVCVCLSRLFSTKGGLLMLMTHMLQSSIWRHGKWQAKAVTHCYYTITWLSAYFLDGIHHHVHTDTQYTAIMWLWAWFTVPCWHKYILLRCAYQWTSSRCQVTKHKPYRVQTGVESTEEVT